MEPQLDQKHTFVSDSKNMHRDYVVTWTNISVLWTLGSLYTLVVSPVLQNMEFVMLLREIFHGQYRNKFPKISNSANILVSMYFETSKKYHVQQIFCTAKLMEDRNLRSSSLFSVVLDINQSNLLENAQSLSIIINIKTFFLLLCCCW